MLISRRIRDGEGRLGAIPDTLRKCGASSLSEGIRNAAPGTGEVESRGSGLGMIVGRVSAAQPAAPAPIPGGLRCADPAYGAPDSVSDTLLEPGRRGLAPALGTEGLLDQLDEPRTVDQLDGVLGDELLGGEG